MTPLAPADALIDVPHPYDSTRTLRASLVPINEDEYGLYPWGGWFRQDLAGGGAIIARGPLDDLRALLARGLRADHLVAAGRATLRL